MWWRERDKQQHPITAATTDSRESGQGPKYDLVTSVRRHYAGGFLAELLKELVRATQRATNTKHGHEATSLWGCLMFGHKVAWVLFAWKLKKLEFSSTTLLYPEVGCGEVAYSPKSLSLADAYSCCGVGVNFDFHFGSKVRQN